MGYASLNEAVAAICDGLVDEGDPETWSYIFENATPELKEMLARGFDLSFPNLKPTYVDKDGNPYYDVETLSRAFGVSPEEICEAAVRLPESSYRPASELHRIQ